MRNSETYDVKTVLAICEYTLQKHPGDRKAKRLHNCAVRELHRREQLGLPKPTLGILWIENYA